MKIPCLVKIEDFFRNLRRLGKLYNQLDMFQSALADPHIGLLDLRMENASVQKKYKYVFYGIKEGDICFDCGTHVGLISDIFLQMGAVVHAFEPQSCLFNMLKYKYKDKHIFLNNAAVSDTDGKTDFYTSDSESNMGTLEGSSVYYVEKSVRKFKYTVNTVDLCQYIQEHIADKNKRIYILKLDVEGSEFDILPKLIETGMYNYADYIFVETHARLFDDGKEKLSSIENLIHENNITNIYLDWV